MIEEANLIEDKNQENQNNKDIFNGQGQQCPFLYRFCKYSVCPINQINYFITIGFITIRRNEGA